MTYKNPILICLVVAAALLISTDLYAQAIDKYFNPNNPSQGSAWDVGGVDHFGTGETLKQQGQQQDGYGYDGQGYDSRGYDDHYDNQGYQRRNIYRQQDNDYNRGYDKKYKKRRNRNYDNRKKQDYNNGGYKKIQYKNNFKNKGYSNAYAEQDQYYGTVKDNDEWNRALTGGSTVTAGAGIGQGDGVGQWRFYPGDGWTNDGGQTFQQNNPFERPKERERQPDKRGDPVKRENQNNTRGANFDMPQYCDCKEIETGKTYWVHLGFGCDDYMRNYNCTSTGNETRTHVYSDPGR